MPTLIDCPGCNEPIPVTEATRATSVECPYCTREFTAFTELGSAPALPTDTAKPKKKARRRDDDDDEDDEDGGKRSNRGAGGSAIMVIVVGGLGLLGVMTGLAVTTWLIFTYEPNDTADTRSTARSTVTPNPGLGPGPGPNRPGPNRPGPNLREPDDNDDNPGFPQPQPKVDRFTLQPVPPSLNQTIEVPSYITPTTPKEITLPGKIGRMAVGGRGRFLLMHFPQQGLLTVFDVATGGLVANVTAPRRNVVLAAGGTKAVMVSEGEKDFQVYSLPELNPLGQPAYPKDVFFGASRIAMGSNTDGPVLVQVFGGDHFLMDIVGDPKMIPGSLGKPQPEMPNGLLRASADGRVFLGSTDNEAGCLTEKGQKWTVKRIGTRSALLSADGRTVFAEDQIINADNGRVVAQRSGNQAEWYVPAVFGNYFLKLTHQKDKEGKSARETNNLILTVHNNRNPKNPAGPISITLPESEKYIEFFGQPRPPQPLDQRLILIPEAKVLVQIAHSGDRLTIRRVLP